MLKDFLVNNYKNSIIPKESLTSILNKGWTLSDNSISRRYVFKSFNEAVKYMSIASNYLTQKRFDFTVNNVYNSVEVVLKGDVTKSDKLTIEGLDYLFDINHDVFGKLSKNNYYENIFTNKLKLKYNNQDIETNYIFKNNDYFQDSLDYKEKQYNIENLI